MEPMKVVPLALEGVEGMVVPAMHMILGGGMGMEEGHLEVPGIRMIPGGAMDPEEVHRVVRVADG